MNSTKIKTYKILVGSKLFANMCGSTPAEVAKKAASKILGNTLNRMRFSIQKNSKIRHYDAKRENLVRPYHKNGKLVKYRIVVKKMGKQVGGTFPPDLEPGSKDPIFDFFPREEYTITIIPIKKYHIMIDRDWCIDFLFNIDEKKIELESLLKCHNKSGTDNLRKIIGYGKYLKSIDKIDIIELFDASYIEHIRISYILLSILSTGVSWYNSFGFVSTNFPAEQQHNSQFLNMLFGQFIDICINICFRPLEEKLARNLAGRLNNKTKKNTEELLKNMIQHKNTKKELLITTFGNLSVQEVFTEIKKKLRSELSQEELDKIIELLKYIEDSKIIIYNPNLTLIL